MPFQLLQIAEQDKLSLVGKPVFKVLGSLVVATIFWGLQEMAEIGFQCPWLAGYNEIYGVTFLVVPALVLTLLSVFLHRECLMCSRCRPGGEAKGSMGPVGTDRLQHPSSSWQFLAFLKVFYHAWVWIIVVLLDGDCYACIHYFLRLSSSPAAVVNAESTQNRAPPKDDSELIRTLQFESRVIGLALLLTLVAISVCISCCHVSRCCGKPYYWWEYQQMYLEEMERIVLNNLKDSATQRAEDNYKNETGGDAGPAGVGDAWEHISSADFAKIEYPDDFRVAPRANDGSPQKERPTTDGASLEDGEEATDQSGTCSERELVGLHGRQGKGEPPAPTDDTHGINGQGGQTGGVVPPGQEVTGKLGWKIRLRDHLQELKKSMRRALGNTLKKPNSPRTK